MRSPSEQKNLQASAAPAEPSSNPFDRRSFLVGAAAGAASLALPGWICATDNVFASASGFTGFDDDLSAIRAEIAKRHDETVQRMQTWMKQPSIAAENRGMNEGCELTMQMLRDAGFQQVTKIPTDGQPGIFATL
ncbi:MAG TPA: twin-arginine translocation signal domain-containing protein, partial [Candidatus Binatia bacterium]|nr:twin-arginine translocation signal domain-containing protein [Candidatus Binatia bacterium]